MNNSAFSYHRTLNLILTLAVFLISGIFFSGCSFNKTISNIPKLDPKCNIQAHIDQTFIDYLSKRFQKGSTPRIGIIPFDVPANFSPIMDPELRFGFKLAENFQQKLLAKGENLIVEIFNRDWPGKKLDFSTGNFIALKQARDAGYDFVLLGQMDQIIDNQTISIQSKLIDLESNSTIWFASSKSITREPQTKGFLNFLSRGVFPLRHDVFLLNERTDTAVSCTVEKLLSWQIPEENPQ